MPPVLHPKSNFTFSLFSTTLALSFLVVGLPHVLPCPVDRKQYAQGKMDGLDVETRKTQLRRQQQRHDRGNTKVPVADGISPTPQAGDTEIGSIAETRRRGRECPVPKPTGLMGQILGFRQEDAGKGRPTVRIEAPSREGHADEGKALKSSS